MSLSNCFVKTRDTHKKLVTQIHTIQYIEITKLVWWNMLCN